MTKNKYHYNKKLYCVIIRKRRSDTMIEFNQLKHLVAIAKNKTISKAAEELLISQPGLTKSMQRLEEDLGLSLFNRKKNKIELNDNGLLAVEFAKKLLDGREEMIKELTKHNQNYLSFASCAPAPLWGIEYTFQTNTNSQFESFLIQDEQTLINGLENGDYSLIVLTHPLDNKNYICQEFLNESLYLSVPPAHPLAPFKEISFSDLDGQSVLLLSHIGFWNEVCKQMIPESHLLFQDDPFVFNELTKMSALPNFKSDITIQRDSEEDNRILIPITDQEAHASYYAIYPKDKKKFYQPLLKQIKDLDWKKTKDLPKVFNNQ
ncbi:LysR family transcriptional regulator [Coprobacillus sp. AF27-24BH]|nr:LysR family transcriptional regulator [Coprobacillus sp. AF27-24BH]RGH51723.1 LysR family transcriptional regulator [Coprobacillus sp. AM37-9BH]RHQ20494.1 LysR family transcriptional regulator [Coprobacillus sp. AF29-3BH]